MANNITPKLKAYVQIDATGRVVSGTPVFRSSKPKIGNWREIPMYYRGTGGSTTTTTTAGGGGVTPTAFIKPYWVNVTDTCNGTMANPSLLFYSEATSLAAGIRIFSDASLTTPITAGQVILNEYQPMQYVKYLVGADGTLSAFECPFILGISYASANGACTNAETYPFYTNGSTPSNGVTLYFNQALTQTANNIPYLSYNGSLFSTDGNGVMAYTGPC